MSTLARRTHARRSLVTLTTVLATAACSTEGADNAADMSRAPAAQDTTGTMAGMQGMAGMQSMANMGAMMDQMQTHLRAMEGAPGDSLAATLPMHRQMVANMISEMNGEMRGMNMSGDARWTTTIDSLRQDNIRLPEMSASELRTFMPEHHARIMRLMDMHRAMMERMKM